MSSEHWQLERGVLGAHNLQGKIFKVHSELENALTLFLIPFLFYNFVKVFKIINIENDLGIGNIIFFMPYKRSKTPDNKTFFFS